jgi:hypothetical protein
MGRVIFKGIDSSRVVITRAADAEERAPRLGDLTELAFPGATTAIRFAVGAIRPAVLDARRQRLAPWPRHQIH